MHTRLAPALATLLLAGIAGCPTPVLEPVPAQAPAPPLAPAGVGSGAPGVRSAGSAGGSATKMIAGDVFNEGEFELFDLGPSAAGDAWTLQPAVGNPTLLVALFDQDQNLIARVFSTASGSLQHTLRDNVGSLIVGVAVPTGRTAGSYRFDAARALNQPIPAPRPQIVYLNFNGAQNLSVNRRTPVSFAPFDAAILGARYRGQTAAMRTSIVNLMRADYAKYDVTIVSSDQGGPPDVAYSTVHFGGDDASLLGLADSVDAYNATLSQNAIVFVQTFARYESMQLSPDAMALMIGNVASHELGHLLGLYHTRIPTDLMDTTGSAWDLATDQSFTRAALEPSVFPAGAQDDHRLLVHTVGAVPSAAKRIGAAQNVHKMPLYAIMRRFTEQQLPATCGTCLHLDD